MLRFLRVDAAQVTVWSQPQWRSKYVQLIMSARTQDRESGHGAETGDPAYCMMREGWDYQEWIPRRGCEVASQSLPQPHHVCDVSKKHQASTLLVGG